MPEETTGSGHNTFLIRGGAVITVDPVIGTLPRADVLVRNGAVEAVGPDLTAADAQIIDATDMIVMPGLIDSHYHMWSTLGRNYLSDFGFEYFQAKWATSELYDADDFHNSVMLGLAELADGG
jgi:5-methylthioadenosine/S-adenosylhomocysteine deaminase